MVFFGLTLPVVRIALEGFDPWFLGFCRAMIATVAGGALLLVLRQPLPRRSDVKALILSALGVVLGFPLLSNWAMQSVPASHGGVVLGLLPLATAVAAVVWNKERPSLAFWLSGLIGSLLVVIFALLDSESLDVQIGDAALLLGIALCGMGYAAGAELAKRIGGWQTISWALLISLPITLPGSLLTWDWNGTPSQDAWIALFYLGLFSQFLGFFFWYRGLALAGVARIGQVQLLQPFVTIAGAALLLSEEITGATWIFAVLVILTVWFGRKTKVAR